MSGFSRAAVIGSGAWGTTFACLLASAGTPTTIWARRAELADEINAGTNARYLPGTPLPAGISATTDLGEAVDGAGIVVVAVPSQVSRQVLAPLAGARWWPHVIRRWRRRWRAPARPRPSGPTPTPTCSVWSCVGRSRTSSPWPWESRLDGVWGTTPRPRSSPGDWWRSHGSGSRWVRRRRPSRGWRAWETSWPPAPLRCHATRPSGAGWGRA